MKKRVTDKMRHSLTDELKAAQARIKELSKCQDCKVDEGKAHGQGCKMTHVCPAETHLVKTLALEVRNKEALAVLEPLRIFLSLVSFDDWTRHPEIGIAYMNLEKAVADIGLEEK